MSSKLPGQVTRERGAALPMVAITLAALFGFVALGVDAASGYSERRRSQSAADASVLAAAVESTLIGSSQQTSLDQALAFADANLPAPIPAADWVACTDTEPLRFTAADFGLIPATACVSWSDNGQEIRVSLPERTVDTYFAGMIGFDTLLISASANAKVDLATASGAPPFVVTDGVQGGDETCLRTGPSGALMPPKYVGNGVGNAPGLGSLPADADSCDETVFDPSSEFYGTLDPYLYEERDPGAPNVFCSQPGATALEIAIADGMDHLLGTYGFDPGYQIGDPQDVDGTGCPSGPPLYQPNTMPLQTGLTASGLEDGLFHGVTLDSVFSPGRLTRNPTYIDGFRFAGNEMDNKPLWDFIRADIAGASVPDSCKYTYTGMSDPDWDYFDIKEEMIRCLQQWKDTVGKEVVFTTEIANSTRFAYIPVLAEANLLTSPVHFNTFVPAFIQTLYQDSIKVGAPDPLCFSQHPAQSGNKGFYRHDAGLKFDCGRAVQNVDRVAALVIDCGMLPATLCTPDGVSPGGHHPSGNPVYIIELVK